MRSLRAVRGAGRALPRRAARAAASCPTASSRPRGVEIVALPPLGVERRAASAAATRATAPSARGRCAARASSPTLRERAAERRAGRAVPVRAREVRARARAAARGGARARARSPRAACATSSSARARTSTSTTTARAALANAHLDADPRPLRPPLRPPGGDVQADARALDVPVHYTGFVARATAPRRTRAASTSSSRPAAGASAGRCSKQAIEASDGRADARDRRAADATTTDYEALHATRAAQRRAAALGPRPRRTSCSQAAREHQPVRLQHRARPPPHRASRRSSCPTRRRRRTSRRAARRRLEAPRRAQGRRRTSTATSTRCSAFTPAPTALDLDGAARTAELL